MPAIVTDQFRIKNAADYIASVGTNKVYMLIGRSQPWPDENAPPIPTDSQSETLFTHWNEALAAKLVNPADVCNVITRYDWVSGDTGYVAYNPGDPALFTKKFYTVAENAGTYSVYKLLVRGGGASTIKPVHTSAASVTGADGYTWKFMYTITLSDWLKFATPQHVPVRNLAVNAESAFGATPYPVGGHGANNIKELGAYYVATNIRLEYNDSGVFTVSNDYRKIGFVYNPLVFNGTAGVFASGNSLTGTVGSTAAFRQTTRLTISGATGVFSVDETISVGANTARVVEHDTTNNFLFVQLTNGTIATGNTITGATSGRTASVTAIQGPGLQPYSGDFMYIENRKPIARSADQIESITIVIEF